MKKTALVTGSSRGIGRAIALRLAKDGHGIILHGLRQSRELISIEKELKRLNAHVLTSCFDISKKEEVESAILKIGKTVESIGVLVNNAGITKDKTFLKMSGEEWDRVIKTNLYGSFFVTQQVLPKIMKNNFGRIINLSSIAAYGAFGKTNYSSSKAGLIGMTKSLALEVGKYNITVNAVCPGYIGTTLSSSIPAKYRKQFLSQIALGRIGTPEEVASLVAFLASEESAYITGAVVDINGGWI